MYGQRKGSIVLIKRNGPVDHCKGECYWSAGAFTGHAPPDEWEFRTLCEFIYSFICSCLYWVHGEFTRHVRNTSSAAKGACFMCAVFKEARVRQWYL